MKAEHDLKRKVLAYINEYTLIPPNNADITVALSGGADSVALLWVLRALAPALGFTLRAAHLHHGIRGLEADRDAAFCRDLCAAWGISCALGRADAPARAAATGESLEEAARKLRYDFLEEAAPGLIATAHNADDNAETLLLRLLRGTGLRGLGGIPPRRGRVIRPLLTCDRAEIEALLTREGLPHVEDATNADDGCLRNRLRHRVLPLLREENPGLSRTLGRTAATLRAEDAYLSRLAAQAAKSCRAGEGWSVEALLALDPVLRRRVLLGLLGDLGLEDPALVYVEALEALLTAGPSARRNLPGGREARRDYGLLRFDPAPAPEPLQPRPLPVPGTLELPDGGRLTCFVTKNSYFSKKNLTTFALKCDMITGHRLEVRSRRPGDRLTLPGGAKTLKALMIDKKIPAPRRPSLPVLTLDDVPIAVPGLGVHPAYAPAPDEEAVVVAYTP